MLVNDNDAVIVNSTINLAHNLGIKVTAEGVETIDVGFFDRGKMRRRSKGTFPAPL
ncbi:MAG: hypothetical protein ACU833_10300 [Gammaproteobacteria bacterium]